MRAALVALYMALAGPAAADCPAFFRFVDFGITDDAGNLYRGGPVFRAEDFDGTPLLATDATVCAEVIDLLKDGRGNPIPVVRKIAYDRREADPALGWIEVAAVADAFSFAEEFAGLHADRLSQESIEVVRGETSLCAVASAVTFSCQIVSPYANDAPVVVYCEDGACMTFGIAMTERLVIAASWPMEMQSMDGQTKDIVSRVNGIAAFLAPISSGL